jgi:penicillin G amidase
MLVRLLREQPDGWFDQPWPQVIADSLETVQHQLTSPHGADPARWAWGRVRPLRFAHPAGQRGLLGQIFSHGPLPGRGDSSTFVQAYMYPGDPPLMQPSRMVIDDGNWQNARWVLPGGESGNPASPHYDDQLPGFQVAQGIPIPWASADVEASTEHKSAPADVDMS